jgi:hypothetical protein
MKAWKYGTLSYNLHSGEGMLRLDKEFRNLPPVVQADLLSDWIYELTQAYNERLDKGLVSSSTPSTMPKRPLQP